MLLIRCRTFLNPFQKNVSPNVSPNIDSESSSTLPQKPKQLTSDVILDEIRWILRAVVSGYSMKSLNDISQSFTVTFPDSKLLLR